MRRAGWLAFFALLSCRTMSRQETGFLDRTARVDGQTYPYTVYVPRDFSPATRLPVILALHGSGERGTDGLRQTQIGVAAVLRSNPELIHALVVFPQAPPDARWLGDPAGGAMVALDRTLQEFHGDPDRVYLTGLSMGGYGTWHLALAHPDRFAALVVVCGGLLPHRSTNAVQRSPLTAGASDPYAYTARALRALPIWIFHGANDTTVPVEESQKMAEALRNERAEVHYTEYAGVNHNSWDRAYREPELWRWLFAQRRR